MSPGYPAYGADPYSSKGGASRGGDVPPGSTGGPGGGGGYDPQHYYYYYYSRYYDHPKYRDFYNHMLKQYQLQVMKGTSCR